MHTEMCLSGEKQFRKTFSNSFIAIIILLKYKNANIKVTSLRFETPRTSSTIEHHNLYSLLVWNCGQTRPVMFYTSLNYLLIHLELHQQLSIIFWTLFLIFEIVVKPSLSFFIYHLITYWYTLNFVNNCTPNFQVCS